MMTFSSLVRLAPPPTPLQIYDSINALSSRPWEWQSLHQAVPVCICMQEGLWGHHNKAVLPCNTKSTPQDVLMIITKSFKKQLQIG